MSLTNTANIAIMSRVKEQLIKTGTSHWSPAADIIPASKAPVILPVEELAPKNPMTWPLFSFSNQFVSREIEQGDTVD